MKIENSQGIKNHRTTADDKNTRSHMKATAKSRAMTTLLKAWLKSEKYATLKQVEICLDAFSRKCCLRSLSDDRLRIGTI